MLLCLLVSIITYIVHHSSFINRKYIFRVIRINRDGWHTLVNFLFHMGVTFSTFATGINQINYPALCTLVGVIIHYASLSTMLWLLLTARNVCTDVSRPPTQTKTAVLRFYVFSNGVPLIVVGVTAVFGLDNYGSTEEALYCWMAWQPSLAAFYGPVALLVLVMSIYFLCTYIQLKRHPERKYEVRIVSSKDKERHCHGEPHGDATATGMSVLANEHSFKAQLRTTAVTLLLFLATWALGALAVTQGHFLDMVFSCLYGAFCVTLGLFLLIQHCAKRDDVWTRWWVCCSSKSEERSGPACGGQRVVQSQPQQRYLDSPCSGKQPLLSPQLAHNHHHTSSKTPPLPPLPPRPLSPAGPCCVSRAASPRPQSLHDDLPRPPLPLQSCLKDRTKSRSFNRPRPCLRDLHGHMTSTSMDGGSGYGSHLDSPHSMRGGLADAVSVACHSPQLPDGSLAGGCDVPWMRAHMACPSPLPDKHGGLLRRQSSCHSAMDPIGSCQDLLARSVHADTISCHSTHFLPSQEGHTYERRLYGTPKTEPLITTISRREISEPFVAQRHQVPETYSCSSKIADEEEDDMLCPDEEQGVYPRCTLPRPLEEEQGVYPRCTLPRPLEEEQGVYPRCTLPRPLEEEQGVYPRCTLPRPRPALSRRSTISRNGSLQEDFLFGSDAAGNVRTGPWRNETAV